MISIYKPDYAQSAKIQIEPADTLFIKEIHDYIGHYIFGKNQSAVTTRAILAEIYYQPGTAEIKLERFNSIEPIKGKHKRFSIIEKHPQSARLKDILFTQQFDELISNQISQAQAQIPYNKSFAEQENFLKDELGKSDGTLSVFFKTSECENVTRELVKHLNTLYNLLVYLHYLSQHKIAFTYCLTEPTSYTLLDPKLAIKLQDKIAFTPALDMSNNKVEIIFFGHADILNSLDDLLHEIGLANQFTLSFNISLNPYYYFASVKTYLSTIKLHSAIYDHITDEFVKAVHGLDSCFEEGVTRYTSLCTSFEPDTLNDYDDDPEALIAEENRASLTQKILTAEFEHCDPKTKLETLILLQGHHNGSKKRPANQTYATAEAIERYKRIFESLKQDINTYLTTGTIQQTVLKQIHDIQEEQPSLKSQAELLKFAEKEMEYSRKKYTIYCAESISWETRYSMFTMLSEIYYIITKVHYLYHHKICDTWEGFNVLEYTIYDIELSQKVNAKQAFKEGLNLTDDFAIHFTGMTWVLEKMNTYIQSMANELNQLVSKPDFSTLDLMQLDVTKLPFAIYEELDLELNDVNVPEVNKTALKNRFAQALHDYHNYSQMFHFQSLPVIDSI
jgi:hypothetical protein